jgi:hypothetical protein
LAAINSKTALQNHQQKFPSSIITTLLIFANTSCNSFFINWFTKSAYRAGAYGNRNNAIGLFNSLSNRLGMRNFPDDKASPHYLQFSIFQRRRFTNFNFLSVSFLHAGITPSPFGAQRIEIGS